jgi:hypothetical protein
MSIVMSTDLQGLSSLLVRLEANNRQAATIQGLTDIPMWETRIDDGERASLPKLITMVRHYYTYASSIHHNMKDYLERVFATIENRRFSVKTQALVTISDNQWLYECQDISHQVLQVIWVELKNDDDAYQFFDFNGIKLDIKDVVWDMTDAFHKLNQKYQISKDENIKAKILSDLRNDLKTVTHIK